MSRRLIVARQARQDLMEIWEFIASDSIRAADSIEELFQQEFLAIQHHPGLGPRREELQPGVRSLPVGSYLIFYRVRRYSVQILRVVHGARDLGALFAG